MADLTALQFERNQLNDSWARFTAERLQKSLVKHKIGDTGSLSYSVIYQIMSAQGDDTSTQHRFNFYGKFIDMGVGKGRKLGQWKDNADVYRTAGKARRPIKWFSKTYYGQIAELRDLQARKYGEQVTGIVTETITQTIVL